MHLRFPRAIGTERLFEVTDGGGLDLPQPRVIEHRHNAHARAEGRRLRICGYLKGDSPAWPASWVNVRPTLLCSSRVPAVDNNSAGLAGRG